MRTFAVSPVTPVTDRLPAVSTVEALEPRVGSPVEAAGARWPLVRTPGRRDNLFGQHQTGAPHAFFEAVHTAFANHYPLVLAPDDIWLCIAQAFGTHVLENAEELRSRFVRHEGKACLETRRDEFVPGSQHNDWAGCFAEFSDKIAEHIGKKRDLVVASFSTTTAVEKVASEIVLMSAMQSYFQYRILSLCGIPTITLLGDEADWRSVRTRAAVLAEFGLDWWLDALLPVLDQFVAAARGQVDGDFWRSFYKEQDESGGPQITGWINALFPYLEVDGERHRNDLTFALACGPEAQGPGSDSLPSGLSSAPMIWSYLGTEIPMECLAGFVGVSQDAETGALRPAIGWGVRKRPTGSPAPPGEPR